MGILTGFAESSFFPDFLKRQGIRFLLRQRLSEISLIEEETNRKTMWDQLVDSPIALHVEKANEQHYEVPSEFFERVLGRHLKYSSCFWPEDVQDLDEAEYRMLELTCLRADIQNGQDILELGCGWGSLTLFMASTYPKSKVTAISNSASQRSYIMGKAKEMDLSNVEVLTCDMNDFSTQKTFDRVVSVEMFEHMRNYKNLMERISNWLKPDGKLFVHIFCHQSHTYTFETNGEHNWMGRFFFTGGLMPSFHLLPQFKDDLEVVEQHKVNGTHYAKTARAWVNNMDNHRKWILQLFNQVYGQGQGSIWFQRWRLFFMACEECFGFSDGNEWWVGHYLFKKTKKDVAP